MSLLSAAGALQEDDVSAGNTNATLLEQSDQRLANILAALPDAALLPVGWIRKQLASREPMVHTEMGELSVSAFGKFIGRSPATVRAWCATGAIPGVYKLPGDSRRAAWRIPVASLVAFRERLQGPKPSACATAMGSDPSGAVNIKAWRALRPRTRAA